MGTDVENRGDAQAQSKINNGQYTISSDYVLTRDDSDDMGTTNSPMINHQESTVSCGSSAVVLPPNADRPFLLPPRLHEQCGRVVHSEVFQQIMLVLIVGNSLLTAIGTFDFGPQVDHAFSVIDTTLLSIFTAELGLHMVYFGPALFSDGWLTFDFIVVTLSWAFQAMSVLRAFRIVRAVRVISKMKDLRDLVTALLRVVPRMGAIASLLLLVYFVFTIFFTELFKDAYANGFTSEDHFSTLGLTAFTLLQFMFLDDWSTVTKELMAEYTFSWVPILFFIITCTFIVMNLIIAVICDAVAALQTDEMNSNLEIMQEETKRAILRAEVNHKEDIQRLENKIDQLTKLLQETKKGV